MLNTVDQVEDFINLTDGACQTPLHRWVGQRTLLVRIEATPAYTVEEDVMSDFKILIERRIKVTEKRVEEF